MAETATSNVDEVLAKIDALIKGFSFKATVEGHSLGEDLAGIVADGIAARSIDESRGATVVWAENREPYRTKKADKYGVDKPNIRTGQMLSHQSLMGQTTITTDQVQMLYGIGEAPDRSSASSYFDPKTDGSITDIEKGWFASKSRPFYELDDKIANEVFARAGEFLGEYLKRG